MVSGLLARATGWLPMFLAAAGWAAATPYPPYPGAVPSVAYKVAVDGQPVFVHNFLTYDQFHWMDYASFSMTGKVHVPTTWRDSSTSRHSFRSAPPRRTERGSWYRSSASPSASPT